MDKDGQVDEELQLFISEWGQPTQRILASEEDLSELSGYVPAILIAYWREVGFSVFKSGLMLLTNPLEWQETVDEWLEGTELESLDRFIPLMRGAFGDFRLFGLNKGHTATLMVSDGAYMGRRDQPDYTMDISIKGEFVCCDPGRFDLSDHSPNFADALKKLGPLHPNEMYGFVPVLPLGGTRDLEHLQKLDAFAHLSILRQATGPLRGVMEYADIYR